MIEQAGFDIKVIINELKELEGARVNKFYNTDEGELLMKLYSREYGKVTLRVLRGECIHLTNFDREVVQKPSSFTMSMRKYMQNAFIKKISQPSFERVVVFEVQRGDETYNIVIELFNQGNVIICDDDMTIINSLRFKKFKNRVIKPGEEYELPSPRFEDIYLNRIEFKREVKSSRRDSLVVCLAVEIGLGGKYAEEICSLSKLDKEKKPGMLSSEEVDDLFDTFFLVYKSVKHYKNIKPCVIIEDEEVVSFAPFPLKSYKSAEFKLFETFNQACDYYYSRAQKEKYLRQGRERRESRIQQLMDRFEKQKQKVQDLKRKSEHYAELGETIFENFNLVNEVLDRLRAANKRNISWNEIKRMVEREKDESEEARIIKEINEDEGSVVLELDNHEFTVGLNSDANEIAQRFFEKSKKLKNKIPGSQESMIETNRKLEEVKSEEVKVEKKIVKKEEKKSRDWYEKYRWLKTSNDFLLVSGKDAAQNEILVKKVAEEDDLIFHASVTGSPFGVLKKGKEAEEVDKRECAEFVAAYSRAWRERISTDVFYVSKSQVSKSPPSGEYVPHGSFIIKGEKEFYHGVRPGVRIGYKKNGVVIAGPDELIKKRCKQSVKLLPGNLEPGKISKRLMKLFDEFDFKSEDFLHFIPGDSRIIV